MRHEAGGHDRVRRERAARRVDRDVVAEAEHLAQQQLLVGERGLQLGHLDRPVAEPGGLGGDAGRRRVVEVAERRVVALGAVVEAGDERRALDAAARARSPVASTMAAAPSVIGGRSWRRSGSRT